MIAPTERGVHTGTRTRVSVGLALVLLAGLVACGRSDQASGGAAAGTDSSSRSSAPAHQVAGTHGAAMDYTPPSDSAIPNDELGASIRRGLALVTHTTDSLPKYATGSLQCSSCHIDAGRRRDAAALIGVYSRFPKYMDRTGAVIPLEDRVNYCFTRSLGGNKIPTGSREMQDIVAYLAFISTGVPAGTHVIGEAMPKLARLTGDTTRGATLFASTCAACHGPQGQGNPPAIPALWGPTSYSIGASMAREERAATFIRHFMPLSNPGSLTDQQAFDVSAYINSHPRPDSPGKENDWPAAGVPFDVPYNTKGHVAYRPPATLVPRRNPSGAVVEPPQSIIHGAGVTSPGHASASGIR
jgi:thiosulfate dehydrogenase